MRSVFAHPNTEALIQWSWLREVQRPWQPTPFNRALFEGDLTIGDPVVESDWPLNPNKAGKAFLDMIKDEWNSTQVLSNKIPNTIKLFKGVYSGRTCGLVHKMLTNKNIEGQMVSSKIF